MSLVCSVITCSSNQTTKVGDRRLKFYRFPTDEKLKARWKTVCESICANGDLNKSSFRICDLHFEKSNFMNNMQLKPNAMPTIFDRVSKRKIADVSKKSTTSAKRHKSDNGDENGFSMKGATFVTSTPMNNKLGPQKFSRLKTEDLNNFSSSTMKYPESLPHYRLIIQVDKIVSRPGPKSQTLKSSTRLRNKMMNSKNIQQVLNESSQENSQKTKQKDIRVLNRKKSNDSHQNKSKDSKNPGLVTSVRKSLPKSGIDNSKSSVQKNSQKSINSVGNILIDLDDFGPKKRAEKKVIMPNQNISKRSVLQIPERSVNPGENIVIDLEEPSLKKVSTSSSRKTDQNNPRKSVRKIFRNSINSSGNILIDLEETDHEKTSEKLSFKSQQNKKSVPRILQRTTNSSGNILIGLEGPKPNKTVANIIKKPSQRNFNSSAHKTFEQLINSSEKVPRCANGCQLQNVVWNNNPAFKCTRCSNIYIPQPIDILDNNPRLNVEESHQKNKSNAQPNQCLTCQKTFQTSDMLYSHIKEHLTCDICDRIFKTQFEYKNHMRLHISSHSSTPFQCHICDSEFETKISIRRHIAVVHLMKPTTVTQNVPPQITLDAYQCKKCNSIFQNEEDIRKHMETHENKIPPCGPFTAIKFSCTVCNMEFPTLMEIQAHTKKHMETTNQERKCNICKAVFTSDRTLSEHLREHVQRAHRCPHCPKAFINETTLKVHLKIHS